MSRPVTTFLNEVVQFLEEEVLPDTYTETRYYDGCVTRVDLEDECVSVRMLSHCVKDLNGQLLRVNDLLSRSILRLNFQLRENGITGSWTDGLVQCTIGLHVPEIDTPFVLKWEGRDETRGVLKADERFDDEREYIEREIIAEKAIEAAIWEHLETRIPSLDDRATKTPIQPVLIQTLYNEDHRVLEELDPIDIQ